MEQGGVCEQSHNLNAYEIKWTGKPSLEPPSEWRKLYPQASFLQINRDNYLEFIGADF